VTAKTGEFLPCLPTVARAEKGSIFDACVDRIWIGERWLEMPDSLELPGVRCPVIPLVSAGDTVVGKLVIHRPPGLATIVRALDQLAEPAG
jgi:hypothetical protein